MKYETNNELVKATLISYVLSDHEDISEENIKFITADTLYLNHAIFGGTRKGKKIINEMIGTYFNINYDEYNYDGERLVGGG